MEYGKLHTDISAYFKSNISKRLSIPTTVILNVIVSSPEIDALIETPDKHPPSDYTNPVFLLVYPDLKYIQLGTAGMMISSLTNLVFPRIMGKTIDVASGVNPPYNLSKQGFMFGVFSTFLTGAIASFIRVYCFGLVSERVAARLRKRLYARILSKDLKFFSDYQTGSLVNKLNMDVQVASDAIVDLIVNGYRYLNSALGGTILLFTISPKLTIISMSIIPIVGSCAMLFSKITKGFKTKYQQALSSLAGFSSERINNITTVRLFSQEHQEIEKFNNRIHEMLCLSNLVKKNRGLFMGGISLSINTTLFSVLYFGGSLVKSGELTIGGLTSFAFYSGFMGLGFSGLSSWYGDYKKVLASVNSLFELMNEDTDTIEEHDLLKPDIVGHVVFHDVVFSYPSRKDVVVLNKINLEIKTGECVALVGHSGAGKTTIASLITKLYTPTSGEILIDGLDMKSINGSWIRSRIAVVDQEPTLFSSSILDNIKYGVPDATYIQVVEAAKQANIHEFIMSLPDQYNTLVGEKGKQLSGGQKQRVAIARAIIKNPSIVILDEATSALDNNAENKVKEAIQNATKDRTVVIIAHRLTTFKNADTIFVMDSGNIVEYGSYQELMSNKKHFYDLVSETSERFL